MSATDLTTGLGPTGGTRQTTPLTRERGARPTLRRHLPLLKFVLRRLALAIPLLFIVSVLTFVVVSMIPGDPATRILGANGTKESYAAIDRQLGLDQPLWTQYWDWLTRVAHGDLGSSIFTHQPVIDQLDQRLPLTLALVVGALAVATVVGVALGTVAAYRRGVTGWIVDVVSWIGFAVPAFWLGYILVGLFAVDIHLLPSSGYIPFSSSPWNSLQTLVLPVVTLAAPGATAIAKQTRDAMDATLGLDFVTALRADGIPERSVVFRHALRSAALPILTMAGLLFVGMLSGTVLVEQVFVLPGLGSLVVNAASSHDLPTIEGAVLYFAMIIVAVNIVIDVLYGWLAPRVRVQ